MQKISVNRIFGNFTLVFNRSEEFARNRLYLLWFVILSNTNAILYGGYFFTGLLLKMGANDAYLGYITIATYVCNLIAIFSPMVLERFSKRKNMLLISRGIFYLILLGFIAAVPFLGIAGRAKLMMILILISAVNLIAAISGSGISVWHLQSIPEEVRSSFFSNLNMIVGVLNMILLNLAGLFADYFKNIQIVNFPYE